MTFNRTKLINVLIVNELELFIILYTYRSVEGHFIKRGNAVPDEDPRFIFTPTVRSNLSFLACVVANGQFPILLEGETSAGKTSIVHYLGKVTGNVVHRINNHEHTDVQVIFTFKQLCL